MPNFEWEPFSSWVRFDFDATAHDGTVLWRGARVDKPGGCTPVDLRSDDGSIEPPLSPAELKYQCDGQPPPCKLQWEPGERCFDLPNTSWALPPVVITEAVPRGVAAARHAQGNAVAEGQEQASEEQQTAAVLAPGLNERAALLGYRSAAAASGLRHDGQHASAGFAPWVHAL